VANGQGDGTGTGGRRYIGPSNAPLRFTYSLAYKDPHSGKAYKAQDQVLSLVHFVPTADELKVKNWVAPTSILIADSKATVSPYVRYDATP